MLLDSPPEEVLFSRPPADVYLPSELWQVVVSYLQDFDIWNLRSLHRVFLDHALDRVYRHAHITCKGIMVYEPIQDFRPNIPDRLRDFGILNSLAALKMVQSLHLENFEDSDCPITKAIWSRFFHQITFLQLKLVIEDFTEELDLTGPCTCLRSFSLTLALPSTAVGVSSSFIQCLWRLAPKTLQTLRLQWDRPNMDLSAFFESKRFPELRRLAIGAPYYSDIGSIKYCHLAALSAYLSHPPPTLTHVALGRNSSQVKIDISHLRQLLFHIPKRGARIISQLRLNSGTLTQLELHLVNSEYSLMDDFTEKVIPTLSQAVALERLKLSSDTFGVLGLASIATHVPWLKLLWWQANRYDQPRAYYIPDITLLFASDIEAHDDKFRKWDVVYLWVTVGCWPISAELTLLLAPYARNLNAFGTKVGEEEANDSEKWLGQWDFEDSAWA
ncbi:hypothetical protein DL96DRAFT_1820526 [Flagelloscypha sp. PMI_526]|nr:hypothetical protein DL96DRAFT_1820526 [Flagelloscypha sp. PMI_526]